MAKMLEQPTPEQKLAAVISAALGGSYIDFDRVPEWTYLGLDRINFEVLQKAFDVYYETKQMDERNA